MTPQFPIEIECDLIFSIGVVHNILCGGRVDLVYEHCVLHIKYYAPIIEKRSHFHTYTSASKNSLCLVICARLPHFYYLDSIGIESPLHFIEVVSEEEHESEVFSNSLESIQVLHHRFQDCYTSLSVPSHPLHFNEVEHEDKSPTSVST